MSFHRLLSHSELTKMQECSAAWDFQFGYHLAGSSLRRREVPILLRDGKAWGAGVQALYSGDDPSYAMAYSLAYDFNQQLDNGLADLAELDRTYDFLRDLLIDYIAGSEPLDLCETELELVVPLPGRSGGTSNKYFFHGFLDGTELDEDGNRWIVEFKLRTQLSSLDQITKSRQIRRYAWAYEREFGEPVIGVKLDERLKALPKPARILKSGKVSHAKDQLTTARAYEAACYKQGEAPKPETSEALAQRRWQQRESVFLTPAEIEEAGEELVSLGKQVAQLDAGSLTPVRNPSRSRCPGCFYREICDDPKNTDLVEALFDRQPPKKDRPPLEVLKEKM